MMLNLGELGRRADFQTRDGKVDDEHANAPGIPRCTDSAGTLIRPYAGPRGEIFPLGSYGHTGWTGGSLWIDPFSKTFIIFLSNRNHPTEAGSVIALRHRLGTFAAEAIKDFDFSPAPRVLEPSINRPSANK